jgi:porin
MYFLADRQLWQQAPDSPYTAYRGIYAGVSAMYAPPQNVAYSQYYEGRLYWIGPFDSRPTDLITLTYNHQVISHYIADATNLGSAFTDVFGRHATNTLIGAYTARLGPGLYFTAGLSYTDNPSFSYFKSEGHALNFVSSLFTAF